MKWSPGCECCDDPCWDCDFPIGVDLTWDTTVISSCDCDFPTTGQLRVANSNRWFDDGLGSDDEADTDCFARWDFAEICCSDDDEDGTYDFAVLVYWVIIDLTVPKAVTVRVFSGRQTASISGGGTGAPCTKNWDLFVTSHGTGTPPNQTIDGWTMSGIKWARTIAPYSHTFSECPSSDQLIVAGTLDQDHRPRNGFPIPLPIAHCATPANLTFKI